VYKTPQDTQLADRVSDLAEETLGIARTLLAIHDSVDDCEWFKPSLWLIYGLIEALADKIDGLAPEKKVSA
jgi:hypothetical protein